MKKFFTKDPSIMWTKTLCPICSEPTGSKSKCYENPPKDIPKHKLRLINPGNSITPIYSKGCGFRKNNLWEATINYPVSPPLLRRLQSIEGVDHAAPVKVYTMQVCISEAFDEKIVKAAINASYRTFIKELQVLENKVLKVDEIPLHPAYIGITLPNGEAWKSTIDDMNDSLAIENLLDGLPDAKGINPDRSGKKASGC